MATELANPVDCTPPAALLEVADRLSDALASSREAQAVWREQPIANRLTIVRNIRREIAKQADQLTTSVSYPHRNSPLETLSAEVLPLADACRFLERNARKVLAPRRLGNRGRPWHMGRVSVTVLRDPFGVVLIIGPANYPLFLPGVQAVQALAAGNAVLLKPGAGATEPAMALRDVFIAAGLEPALFQVLPEDPKHVHAAISTGVDKVILTGSAAAGRSVQQRLAETLTPSAMELSGCDAVFVMDSADMNRVAASLAFGLNFNNSATCIAPRRVLVQKSKLAALQRALVEQLKTFPAAAEVRVSARDAKLVIDAMSDGATVLAGDVHEDHSGVNIAGPIVLTNARPEMQLLKSDVFAPVLSIVSVESMSEAIKANQQCPFALGASVFGNQDDAEQLAARIDAGCVVVNDIIAPTADPRVPFGGRRESGFGVTRGLAGLEEMTQLKAVASRGGNWLPHLEPETPFDAELLQSLLALEHGNGSRWKSLWGVVRAALGRRRWSKEHSSTLGGTDVQN